MRIRCKPWAKPELEACEFCINEPESLKGRWDSVFTKKSPLYLELGCGKGGFISQVASANPDVNFIAVDIKNEMLVLAKRKIEEAYNEKNLKTENIKIFIKNIEQINDVFGDGDKIDRIYINFCNPWPRGKHQKKRLTHTKQLKLYKNFLKQEGEINFKTDDDDLFIASLEYFEEAGFEIVEKTYDLHNEPIFEKNIETEHEKMFTEQGIKIKALIAILK